jgi:glucose/arabinose dehydrogenase
MYRSRLFFSFFFIIGAFNYQPFIEDNIVKADSLKATKDIHQLVFEKIERVKSLVCYYKERIEKLKKRYEARIKSLESRIEDRKTLIAKIESNDNFDSSKLTAHSRLLTLNNLQLRVLKRRVIERIRYLEGKIQSLEEGSLILVDNYFNKYGKVIDLDLNCPNLTPTPAVSPTVINTATNTPVSPTATVTAVATATNTPLATLTRTPVAATPTRAPSSTSTPKPTNTSTRTPVPTFTSTVKPTNTAVPTNTPLPTSTATAIPVPTRTFTPTIANTPTKAAINTPTTTATATFTATPINTPTVNINKTVTLKSAFSGVKFSQPIDFQTANDNTGRIYIVEKGGIIKSFLKSNPTQVSTFLDITRLVSKGGEQGLLGLAFHPNYATNGYFYVNYTDLNGDTRIARFSKSSSNATVANPDGTILLAYDQPYNNHNGGQIAFGPDGYLYISAGDGGSGGDPEGNGQKLNTLLGKILRIDVDGGFPYAIPRDNPFVGNSSAKPEIYAYGLRNPWRFSFDFPTNRLWVGDVGQGALEEVNIVEKGKNYGWVKMEGSQCFNQSNCDKTGLELPVFEYPRSVGRSITGGRVYRGKLAPSLNGKYLVADFVTGIFFALTPTTGKVESKVLIQSSGIMPSAFGADQDGEVYVLDFGSGQIFSFEERG